MPIVYFFHDHILSQTLSSFVQINGISFTNENISIAYFFESTLSQELIIIIITCLNGIML